MIYLVSDVHGCLKTLQALLEQVNFDEEKDKLFILGDIIDRGLLIWELYEWVKQRYEKSVYMILGNHESEFIVDVFTLKGRQILDNKEEITEENERYVKACRKHRFPIDHYKTIERLTGDMYKKTIDDLLEMALFFEDLPLYYEIEMNGINYRLVHACCREDLEETTLDEFVWDRSLAETDYFVDNTTVIYGHTPTIVYEDGNINIEENKETNARKINIDCGCVFGNKLCLFRLNDEAVFYQKVIG